MGLDERNAREWGDGERYSCTRRENAIIEPKSCPVPSQRSGGYVVATYPLI